MFVVWKLARLARSPKNLWRLMEQIDAIGAGFRNLTEAIVTTTPDRMMMQMVSSFAEFDRSMIRGRTKVIRRSLASGARWLLSSEAHITAGAGDRLDG